MTDEQKIKEYDGLMSLMTTLERLELDDNAMWQVRDQKILCYMTCNDLFWWGVADAEYVTVEDVPLLEQTFADIEKLGESRQHSSTSALFIARKRKRRPQEAYYRVFSEMERPLFDACGTKEEQYPHCLGHSIKNA